MPSCWLNKYTEPFLGQLGTSTLTALLNPMFFLVAATESLGAHIASAPSLPMATVEPDAKRAKLKVAACLSCRCMPGKKPWAEDITLSGGRVTPVGDRCMACHTLWQKAFGYLEWAAFAAFIKTEACTCCREE
eukprot:6480154-Amphidinium_carterae.2